ncbi:hypothetical protein HL653_10625 [Sphingomonas sp. AP4-R1]|uniref:hypothetical protein n=1 Tax=Sphingomonas sp. AP4-R1 TaxID=2735134 RepID=UPI0014937A2E|nr:hypothetical protein [Sphingomonas sp. AP4-R1]QJU58190.1 hypothetical protein HL653_10625 [Sphingomonas sp. AP4-R1]
MAAADAEASRSLALSAISSCDRVGTHGAAFERRSRWRIRSGFDNTDHRALTAAQTDADADARHKIGAYDAVARMRRDLTVAQREAEQKFSKIPGSIDAPVADLRSSLGADLRRAKFEWRGSLGAKTRLWGNCLHERAILWQAAAAFIVILINPYAIRLFCYIVLAPIAMRRPAIRIHAPAGSAIVPPAARSQTSVGIRLAAGHELLVRQDHL